MKRLHILTKPTKIADLAAMDIQADEDRWLLEAEHEKIQIKRHRHFKHRLAS